MSFKETITTTQAIVSVIAVFVGGLWTYDLFIKERKHVPHINVEQKASHIRFTKGVNVMRLAVELTNTGNSLAKIQTSLIRIQQVLPQVPCVPGQTCVSEAINVAVQDRIMRADRFTWPLLSERTIDTPLEIEPGEKEMIDFEFAVPSHVKVVRIYSYFRNETKRKGQSEMGWGLSNYYDFGANEKGVKK